MSIKRPRRFRQIVVATQIKDFKSRPGYWRKRLFKSVYFYRGKRVAAKNWSVKIQHLGERRTISLSARNAADAAIEACRLYQAIIKKGWSNIFKPDENTAAAEIENGPSSSAIDEKLTENYWAQKLIHRQHTVHLHAKAQGELSARIEHMGISHYFPLQTKNPEIAARKALRIFQTVVDQDWEKTFAQFPREVTLAFRWSDSPLAWTYTTIHTEIIVPEKEPVPRRAERKDKLSVAIAEPDASIREALVSWINRMEMFHCAASFSSAAEALNQLKAGGIELLLSSQNLTSQSGTTFAEQLEAAAPGVAQLLYSTYEDSEELFRATPGGSGVYLLKRTPPTKFLEPIEVSVKKGIFSPARMTSESWNYFKDTVAFLPVQNSDPALTSLTRREHEVLALLAKGSPDKEIADRLHISIWTVNGHVKNIFDKLNVHNRTGAVLKYLQK